MGVHSGHSPEPRQEPRTDQMGRPFRRHLQVPEVRGRGSAVGEEEEQQQHDLREAQSGHEILLQARDPGACGWTTAGL